MSDGSKELLKVRGGRHIWKLWYFSQNMPTSHAVSLALLMHACHFCHALAYVITANGVFLCLLGPPLRFLWRSVQPMDRLTRVLVVRGRGPTFMNIHIDYIHNFDHTYSHSYTVYITIIIEHILWHWTHRLSSYNYHQSFRFVVFSSWLLEQ